MDAIGKWASPQNVAENGSGAGSFVPRTRERDQLELEQGGESPEPGPLREIQEWDKFVT